MIVLDHLHLEYIRRDTNMPGTEGLHVEFRHESIDRELFRDLLDAMIFVSMMEPSQAVAAQPAQDTIDTPVAQLAPVKTTPVKIDLIPVFAPGDRIRVIADSKTTKTGELGTVVKIARSLVLVEFGTDDGRWVMRRKCELVPPDGGAL